MTLTVFLTGLGATPQMWQDHLNIAAPDSPMAAPWLLGLRPGTDTVFSREKAATQILGLTNEHGVDSLNLIGHGLGAAVAVTAAEQSPEIVAKLVLVAPIPKIPALLAQTQIAALKAAPPGRHPDRVNLIAAITALSGFDTVKAARKLTTPCLVLDDFTADFNERVRAFLAE